MTAIIAPPPGSMNLASPRLGAEVIAASDDFFADKSRLIDPKDPVFIPGKYDANGKWMDGWESRRRRGPGHDWCIVRLGRSGLVEAFEIDTRHFTGNYPPAASIDVSESAEGDDFRPLVPLTALAGNSRRLIGLETAAKARRIRLNIFPDGGVARLRVHGRFLFDPTETGDAPFDLLAAERGGRAIHANDSHFGAPENMLMPGRGIDMGDGWETRRRREPGHDWAILALGTAGRIERILIDTAHFKGNYPESFSLDAAFAPGRPDELLIVESQFWQPFLARTPLGPDAEHVFTSGFPADMPITHVRLNIHPDGGVSRLRLIGRPIG